MVGDPNVIDLNLDYLKMVLLDDSSLLILLAAVVLML